jgi:ribosome-associated protein
MTNPTALTEEFTPYLTPIFERRAKSITALDVRKMTSYTDMIIIVEGASGRQVTSLAEHVIKAMKKENIKVLGMEGIKGGEWALLDYGHIIIHVFESKAKDFYDLEGLWSDAPRIDLSKFGPIQDPEEDDDDDDDDDY